MTERNRFTVDADWLQERLWKPGLSIVDASWYLPAQKRDAKAEYAAAHIPGATFFDLDAASEPQTALPHMLPSPEDFARYAGSMGVAADDTIVVYDGPGLFSAPRVWWMFRVMGASNVRLLDGGFDRWKREGRPATAEVTKIAPCVFDVDFDAAQVASLAAVREAVETGSATIADARPEAQFAGRDPEPRPGLRSGHMPGAINLPFTALSRDGSLLPAKELKAAIEKAGIDLARPIVTTCGSGVTAAAITLALETLGHHDNRLYDGSWAEWGARSDTPIESDKG